MGSEPIKLNQINLAATGHSDHNSLSGIGKAKLIIDLLGHNGGLRASIDHEVKRPHAFNADRQGQPTMLFSFQLQQFGVRIGQAGGYRLLARLLLKRARHGQSQCRGKKHLAKRP